MKPSQDNYPIFEANQVLTSTHLNQIFNYLDEQERLTRANLIGIGIVCGLEISLDPQALAGPTINLTKGCGVTSEGYLIVEPDDVALVSYRSYTPPTDPVYAPFLNGTTPFNLWELFPDGEPNTTPLSSPADFLSDKAVLLFLELDKEGLRNCSLNNCDDRGAEIVVTVRRLLIGIADLKTIMANSDSGQGNVTFADLEASLLARLNLPDLRLPRVDVPNTSPATSQDVLAAFLAVFQTDQLAVNTEAALSAAYEAFQPLLQGAYPADPFTGFIQNFGFLDDAPATTTQVRFLQYYYDLFDDLLKGYEEFRRKGIELLCVCVPPDGLFPRHLMLGVLFPDIIANPGVFRQLFLASPATGCCGTLTKEVVQLFARTVEMTARFSNAPTTVQPLLANRGQFATDIRITPSKLGEVPLSDKAIPYYYQENGTPPLYQLWNYQKTRQNRANQNLSYRSDEYQPPAPPFITNALRYDLEPYNFLRIEGHLGKNYQAALNTLLILKARYRLPIDVIALHTGAFDETITVNPALDDCRFRDLEALYATLKGESICLWCNEVQYFYALPAEVNSTTTPTKPILPLLVGCAPDFMVQPGTLGRIFEDYLSQQPGGAVPDIDPNIIINFLNNLNLGQSNIILFYVIIYISKLYEQLTADLTGFDFASFETRYRNLIEVTEAVEKEREQSVGNIEGNANLLNWEELDDRLEDLIYQCRLDAFRALFTEYTTRLRDLKQQLFLSYYLQNNPGIQHKAGVPLGGTFILVHHHTPAPQFTTGTGVFARTGEVPINVAANRAAGVTFDTAAVKEAFSRISTNKTLAVDPDIRLILGAFTGQAPDFTINLPPKTPADAIIDQAVGELAEGTVIADFYLPYLCSSDCQPIQFVLPKSPPTFTVQIACANQNDQAEVTVTPEGGQPPYSVRVDSQDYQPIAGVLVVSAGTHTLTVRDQEGTESAPQTINVPQQLTLSTPSYDCIGGNNDYVATFTVSGGTPPYAASRGTVSGASYASDALPGDTDVEITITDSNQCTAHQTVNHSCTPALAFTFSLGCTTANNQAPLDVTATGGTPPYQLQIDTANPAPLAGTVQLNVGAHTLSVVDAAGAATAPQSVTVPANLVLTETDFSCSGTASYRTFVRIDGGAAPYVANGKPVVGNSFVSDPIASGTQFTITVTDSNNCTATLSVQHSCEQPCDLPCGGQSRRCSYRLWMQPPTGNAQYKVYDPIANLAFRFNGKDLPLNVSALPVIQPDQLNADFNGTVAEFVKALNDAVSQALVADEGASAANRLVITYAPAATDPFAVLLIEHFVCDSFNFGFRYVYAMPNTVFTLSVAYSNEPDPSGAPFDGAVVTNLRLNNKQTVVPAFACAERNQCTGSDYQQLCTGPDPKPSFTVKPNPIAANLFTFTGNVDGVAETDVTAWVWDMEADQPSEPFFQGQTVQTQLPTTSAPVTLTVITKTGCFGSVQQNPG